VPKFKVNATLVTTMHISKTVEAKDLQSATIKVIKETKLTE
jgi:hypothetical protein